MTVQISICKRTNTYTKTVIVNGQTTITMGSLKHFIAEGLMK